MGSVLTIGGVAVDPTTDDFLWGKLVPHARDGIPTLTILRRGVTLAALPDQWSGKTASLTIDGTLYFAGDWQTVDYRYVANYGWVLGYTAKGLKARGDYIPLIDDNTHTTTARYNLAADDPDAILSRSGRTAGEIIASVLEFDTNSANLTAAGLCAYTSAGSGASATAVVSGGLVTGTTGLIGGSGYSTAPSVLLIGGGYTTRATAHATVAAGAVTGIVIDTAGAGYKSPPQVVISRLPAQTILDLYAAPLGTIVVPYPVTCSGEKLFSAIDGLMKEFAPNHTFHVEPTGQLRFLDTRLYTPTAITLGVAADRWEMPSLRRTTEESYSRVQIQGSALTEPVLLSLSNGGLVEQFGHDGLTSAAAKLVWKESDWRDPGTPSGLATANPSISGGHVTAVTPQSGGFGYTSAPAVAITGGGGTGAVYTANVSGGAVVSFTQVSTGSGYTTPPTVAVAPPPGVAGQSDTGTCTCPNTSTITVTSTGPTVAWGADYWDQTDGGRHGTIFAHYSGGAGLSQDISRPIVANTSLAAGGTSDITVSPALPNILFDSYRIVGNTGGASNVWRLYGIADPVKGHALSTRFSNPVAMPNADATATTVTSTPQMTVLYSADGLPPYSEKPVLSTIDPDNSTVLASVPVVNLNGSAGNLAIGGPSTDGIPSDVHYFAAVNKGALTATCPADSTSPAGPAYAGTLHSVEGIDRTLVVPMPAWRDPSNQANMDLLACEILDSVKNTIVEGTITRLDKYLAALVPGLSFNVFGDTYDTPFEDLALPCVEAELEWSVGPVGPLYKTTLSLSNRMAHYSGQAYLAPPQTAGSLDLGGSDGIMIGGSGGGPVSGAGGGMMSAPGSMADQFRGQGIQGVGGQGQEGGE